jgi:hypothetical protein
MDKLEKGVLFAWVSILALLLSIYLVLEVYKSFNGSGQLCYQYFARIKK